MTMNEILLAHKEGKMTAEEANKALAEIGCDLTLDVIEEEGNWTAEEMEQGFRHVEPSAVKPLKKVDLSRKPEFAGTVQYQIVRGTKYAVHYDDIGYAVKAVKQ